MGLALPFDQLDNDYTMKQLLALAALFLTLGMAHAQTPVTKLPGEENLSLRERAERDFLMPVRRKKEAVRAAAPDNATASPENDATAHATASVDDARPEEASVAARETHTTRSYAARHAAWLSARRAEARAEERASERRAARRSSSKRSSRTTHSTKASRSKAVRTKNKTKSKAARAKEARVAKSSKSHRSTTKTKHKAAAKKVTSHKKSQATKKKATASHKSHKSSKKKHRR